MMLDRMRRFAEAQDERSRKNHARKLDNLRRSLKAPFLVGYSRFFYFLTLGGTAGIFLAETASWLKYGIYSAGKYLQNASFSMFLFWLIFGGTAFLLSLARFFQLQKSGPQEAEEDEEDEHTRMFDDEEEESDDDEEPRRGRYADDDEESEDDVMAERIIHWAPPITAVVCALIIAVSLIYHFVIA